MVTQEDAYGDLKEFSKKMIEVLDISKDKYGDFTQREPEEFIPHLLEEVKEVIEDIERGQYEEAEEEAIDVANMAFMIWWRCRNR